MPTTDLLKAFGLSRNPFTDRTAEKTEFDPLSLYVASDLRGFKPSETTYIFFGRRGSGKTTIRLQLEAGYRRYNAEAASSGRSRGLFMVDLCKPGHMTACLSTFQEAIGASIDNWDASFSEMWRTSDLVDCILSYASTELVSAATTPGARGQAILDALRSEPRMCRQFLLLAHLYSRTDVSALTALRSTLLKPMLTAAQVTVAASAGVSVVTGTAIAARDPRIADAVAGQYEYVADRVAEAVPLLRSHGKLAALAGGTLLTAGVWYYLRWRQAYAMERARMVQSHVRVVKPQPTEVVAQLLSSCFSSQDSVDTIRLLCIGA